MLIQIFCEIDDFCKEFDPILKSHLLMTKRRRRMRKTRMSMSEIMTIIVYFHLSRYRDFKSYYHRHILGQHQDAFPNAVSYSRFVGLMKRAWLPLGVYLNARCLGEITGISFIDSAALRVCHNLRINSNKVFRGVARRGRTSTGWFYGFKLHLVASDRGGLLAVALSPGNTDDRNRRVVGLLTQRLFGKLFGDKGYLSQELFETLRARNIELITKIKRNMKNRLMHLFDKILLRKRAIIESIIDFFKNVCQLEHSRHRSVHNFTVNLIGGLIAYSYLPKKPSLRFNSSEIKALQEIL